MFRSRLQPVITGVITALQQERLLPPFIIPFYSLAVPENPSHGDYATNAALLVAKLAGRPPMEIAELIASRLVSYDAEGIKEAVAAAPGFVNIKFSDGFLRGALDVALRGPERWWKRDSGKGKTVRVEYFQLNIAKRPHIGHLRSAVIGDAVKRMLLAFGYDAKSDTHVGDWGTQFGILLLAYKEAGKPEIQGDPFDALEELYVAENERIASDPARREKAKEEFAKLERGDSENRKIWEWMVEVSMEKLEATAGRLGLLPFEMHKAESFYEDRMSSLVELALQKGVAGKTSEGAVIVDLSADWLDEAVLTKSDGASTYLLRDLATIRYMKETLHFAENLYVVDVRQSHHFRQLFRIAELLGYEGVDESRHIEFGFMTSPEGALSTRKGTAISLDAVLDEARERALKVIREKNPDLAEPERIAEVVGIGALKYFDLAHHRRSDYVFRWDEALAFEGGTGPYLQYTHARLKSILRRAAKGTNGTKVPKDVTPDAVEHRLLVTMLRLPEAVEDALKGYTPNTLANYLYGLAQFANEFYHSHPVIQEPDAAKRALRLALVAGVALTLKTGLTLLGIAAPEEM